MKLYSMTGRILRCAALSFALSLSVLASGYGGEGIDGLMDSSIQLDGGQFDHIRERNVVVLRNNAIVVVGDTRITARNMVYNLSTKEVYAEGDVSFSEPGGSNFTCDRLFFDVNQWHGIAENVHGKAQKADSKAPVVSVVSDLKTGTSMSGSSYDGVAKDLAEGGKEIRRMVVSCDQLRSINRDHQEGINARVTPSLFAKPHWWFESKAVNLRRGEKIESWHNILKIGGVPVFYFPYMIKDLKYDWPWLRIAVGSSDRHGSTVYTTTGWDFDESKAFFALENLFLDFDWREDRGWAFGLETDYKLGEGGKGFFNGYILNEDISTSADSDRAEFVNEDIIYKNDSRWEKTLYGDDTRYMIDWEHIQVFNERWDLRAEAHKDSDRDVRFEYNEWSYKEDKDLETSFDLRRWDPQWQMELVATKRLNDWQSQTEYLPELRVSVPGFKLGDTPVYLKSETRLGSLTRRIDTDLDKYGLTENANVKVKEGDSYGPVTRLHQDVTLQAPIHLGPAVFKPWVGGRATYYSKTYGRPVADSELTAYQLSVRNAGRFDESHVEHGEDSVTNTAFVWGADLSTRWYGLFKDNTVRHTIEPTLSFVGRESPDTKPEWLYYFDDIDEYDEEHYLRFELDQKLETKARGEIASFNLSFRYYPREQEALKLIMAGVESDNPRVRHFTELQLDSVFHPTRNLTIGAWGKFDPYELHLDSYSVYGDWTYKDRLRLYAQHQFSRGNTWRYPEAKYGDRDDYSRTTIAARAPLWNKDSRYSGEVAFTYDWKEDNKESFGGIVEQRYTLIRDLDTFEFSVSVVRDRQSVVDDPDKTSTSVYFELTPKGWMGVDRPSSASDLAIRQMPSRYGNQVAAAYADNTGTRTEGAADSASGEGGLKAETIQVQEPEIDAAVAEDKDDPLVIKPDTSLTPGKDDKTFKGDLPQLQDVDEEPDPIK